MNRTGDTWKKDTYKRMRAEAAKYQKAAALLRKECFRYRKTLGVNSAAAVYAFMNYMDYRGMARERLLEAKTFKNQHEL